MASAETGHNPFRRNPALQGSNEGGHYGMKELLTYIAQNLVEHPESVNVTELQGEGETILELRVAPDDMGKVIGRQGRIAKHIRSVVRAMAQQNGTRVSVEIVD